MSTDTALREEVETLAGEAFHRHLISGYGSGEYDGEYQIVYQGKPRHLPLDRARTFLENLLQPESTGITQLRSRWRIGFMLLLESYRRRTNGYRPE